MFHYFRSSQPSKGILFCPNSMGYELNLYMVIIFSKGRDIFNPLFVCQCNSRGRHITNIIDKNIPPPKRCYKYTQVHFIMCSNTTNQCSWGL